MYERLIWFCSAVWSKRGRLLNTGITVRPYRNASVVFLKILAYLKNTIESQYAFRQKKQPNLLAFILTLVVWVTKLLGFHARHSSNIKALKLHHSVCLLVFQPYVTALIKVCLYCICNISELSRSGWVNPHSRFLFLNTKGRTDQTNHTHMLKNKD